MKFWGILIGVLGIIGVSSFIYLGNLHDSNMMPQSKTKALQNILGREVHLSSQDQTVWNIYKSKYLEFTYPSWAIIYTKDDKKAMQDSNILDSFSFNLGDQHITAVVQAVKFTDKLTEFPSVNVRLIQKDSYTVEKKTPLEIDFSKDGDNIEKSAFIQGSGEIVSVAVTGYGKSGVGNIFNKVMESLKIY